MQAQTVTVWRQAEKNKVSKVGYVNKMDREGANHEKTLEMMREVLQANPVLLQLPVGSGPSFRGVVDLLELRTLEWRDREGRNCIVNEVKKEMLQEALEARQKLAEQLGDFDEDILQLLLEEKPIDADLLRRSIRRLTLQRKVVPILLGSSFKNRGVQPLLDSVVDFLPSPSQVEPPVAKQVSLPSEHSPRKKSRVKVSANSGEGEKSLTILPDVSAPLVCLAFKVVHHPHIGLLVYLRVYSGSLSEGGVLLNTNSGQKERAVRLLMVEADQTRPLRSISAGNICAVVGLKNTSTGDTLTLFQDKHYVQLSSIPSPPPVFFASLEPESSQQEKQLEEALALLQKEDPSFSISLQPDTQQLQVGGMGELHLEVLFDRLLKHYKVRAQMGKVRIAYKSHLASSFRVEERMEFTVGGANVSVEMEMQVEPLEGGSGIVVEFPTFQLEERKKRKKEEEKAELPEQVKEQLENGVVYSCEQGVEFGIPIVDIKVKIVSVRYPSFEQGSSQNIVQVACSRIFLKAARQVGVVLLEPKMEVEICVPESLFGSVVSDINTTRRGSIVEVREEADKSRTIVAEVPLKEMVGYSSIFRSITHGNGSYSMKLRHYGEVDAREYTQIVKEFQGY